MKLNTALLCDFAQVRQNLLFISSGGISRIQRAEYPAPLRVHLALMIEVHPIEADHPHEVEVFLQSQDGHRLASLKAGFQLDPPPPEGGVPDEYLTMNITLPLVVPMTGIKIPEPGRYAVEILIDATHVQSLPIRAVAKS